MFEFNVIVRNLSYKIKQGLKTLTTLQAQTMLLNQTLTLKKIVQYFGNCICFLSAS